MFTNDKAALEQAIRRTQAGGSTSLYNALYTALSELKGVRSQDTSEVRRQAIVAALGRRGYVEPRDVRRCARPGEAIGSGRVRDRPA